MKYKIEKKVKMPEITGGRAPKYPFKEMCVGDSFYVDGEYESHNASMSAYQYGRRSGLKFRSAKEGNGRRIWRIE